MASNWEPPCALITRFSFIIPLLIDTQTTCGEDGKIIVWDLTGEERKVETVIEGVIVTASPG